MPAAGARADLYEGPLNAALARFGISTPIRVAGFLSQIAEESGELRRVIENLNYSAESLVKVWPKRFTPEEAKAFARKPEAIANRAYANRNGNGPEASGDGWLYRGRGLIQITGRRNYRKCGVALQLDLETSPCLLAAPEAAALSAAWCWDANRLNQLADQEDIAGITHAINGGYAALEDRKSYFRAAKTALSA